MGRQVYALNIYLFVNTRGETMAKYFSEQFIYLDITDILSTGVHPWFLLGFMLLNLFFSV